MERRSSEDATQQAVSEGQKVVLLWHQESGWLEGWMMQQRVRQATPMRAAGWRG